MQRDVAIETLRKQYDAFRDDMITTKDSLIGLRSYVVGADDENRIYLELQNAIEQATDANRPGCGRRCRGHIETIRGLLETPPTELAIPTLRASENELDTFFKEFQSLVQASLDSQSSSQEYIRIKAIVREINNALNDYQSPEQGLEKKGLLVLSELDEISKDIERRANELLPQGEKVTHTPIDPGAGRLGEIVYSLKDAFVSRPNMAATILSLIVASIVDVFPIAIALVAFAPGTLPTEDDDDEDLLDD